MATLIMTKAGGNLDSSIRAKTMAFLQKLTTDDTTPGLHIEPMKHAADPRVRTGRVDQFWRAVLFRVDSDGEAHYVFHGVWPHDDAIRIARRTRLRVNPVNGLPQFDDVPEDGAETKPWEARRSAPSPRTALLPSLGRTREELSDTLGIPEDVTAAALAAPDEDAILTLAQAHEGWVGLLLIDLATGESVQEIAARMQLSSPTSTDNDTDLIASLQQPAARTQFAFIDGQDELRRVIEGGDFGAWRIFLHPEQRSYVSRAYGGPFRLSGGAGTGKTVILVHRARRLARENPSARIVLTTFTTTLAESLRDALIQLDPGMPVAPKLGDSGVHIASVDSLAAAVIRDAQTAIANAVDAVLGDVRVEVGSRTPSGRWQEVLATTMTDLSPQVANETFLEREYALVVLPNRIRTETDYLHVRRPGRGLPLDRAKRSKVWSLVQSYRAHGRVAGTVDFAEAAAVAAAHLTANPDVVPADHVLVDEAQDLTPPQLQLMRALAAPGPDDLFLAEDSHQRIYGPRVVLSRYGINVVGRSRRLTLNYRTTAQNLRYALTVLDGATYTDLEDQLETTGYRSARTGPVPRLVDVAGLDAELTAIAEQAQAWIGVGTPAGTIAVLVQDRYQRDRVTARLSEAGVPARALDRGAPPTDRVLVLTMHRAKGMEFAKVVLTDADYRLPSEQARLEEMDPTERADTELRLRSLQYVAATRARDELVVLRRPTVTAAQSLVQTDGGSGADNHDYR